MNIGRQKRILESTYDGTLTAYISTKKKVDGETKLVRETLCENIKCALSKVNTPSTRQTDAQNVISYESKVFIPPELNIPPGSEIEVSQYGRTYQYINSGEAFVYPTHQELLLERKGSA